MLFLKAVVVFADETITFKLLPACGRLGITIKPSLLCCRLEGEGCFLVFGW